MLRVYQLTRIGRTIARSTHNPNSPAYRIVCYLDRNNSGTPDQIAEFCGLGTGEASALLHQLRRKGVVTEITGVDLEG